MPLIHIKSLPLDESVDVDATIQNLLSSFAAANNIGIEHVTVTWEFFAHHAEGGEAGSDQIVVDLLMPDFNSANAIEKMLVTTASSLSEQSGIAINNIFINCQLARSGLVFDAGRIVRW